MDAIILGLDGVINERSDQYIKSAEEWVPIPGSLEAIARLNHAGYHVAVISNQPGISEGQLDIMDLNAIHNKMYKMLTKLGGNVDLVSFCPHTDKDGCDCKMPLPALYNDIANRWGITLKGIHVVSDNREDLEAAIAVGGRPVLVRTGQGDKTLSKLSGLGEVSIYDNLKQAADALLAGVL